MWAVQFSTPGNNGDARPTQAPSSQRSRFCAGLAASWSPSGEYAASSGSTWRRPSSRSWQLSSWSAGSWASSGEWTWSSWQVSTPFVLICFEVFEASCVCLSLCVCMRLWGVGAEAERFSKSKAQNMQNKHHPLVTGCRSVPDSRLAGYPKFTEQQNQNKLLKLRGSFTLRGSILFFHLIERQLKH